MKVRELINQLLDEDMDADVAIYINSFDSTELDGVTNMGDRRCGSWVYLVADDKIVRGE